MRTRRGEFWTTEKSFMKWLTYLKFLLPVTLSVSECSWLMHKVQKYTLPDESGSLGLGTMRQHLIYQTVVLNHYLACKTPECSDTWSTWNQVWQGQMLNTCHQCKPPQDLWGQKRWSPGVPVSIVKVCLKQLKKGNGLKRQHWVEW